MKLNAKNIASILIMSALGSVASVAAVEGYHRIKDNICYFKSRKEIKKKPFIIMFSKN